MYHDSDMRTITRQKYDHGRDPWKSSSDLDEGGRRQVYELWYQTVGQYSRTNLTRATDKLPAISGVAKQFQHRLDDEYLAGLCKSHVMFGLLWILDLQSSVSVPPEYRAPTLSWASLDAQVDQCWGPFNRSRYPLETEMIDVALTYVGEDKTAAVTGGHMRLRGPLRAATMSASAVGFPWRAIVNGTAIDLAIWYDVLDQCKHGLQAVVSARYRPGGNQEHVPETDPQAGVKPETPSDLSLYFLPLLREYNTEPRPEAMYGLVLARVGERRGQYIRVGVFKADSPEHTEVISRHTVTLEEDLWEEAGPDGRYVITIV